MSLIAGAIGLPHDLLRTGLDPRGRHPRHDSARH